VRSTPRLGISGFFDWERWAMRQGLFERSDTRQLQELLSAR
jgi:hypothetical protein